MSWRRDRRDLGFRTDEPGLWFSSENDRDTLFPISRAFYWYFRGRRNVRLYEAQRAESHDAIDQLVQKALRVNGWLRYHLPREHSEPEEDKLKWAFEDAPLTFVSHALSNYEGSRRLDELPDRFRMMLTSADPQNHDQDPPRARGPHDRESGPSPDAPTISWGEPAAAATDRRQDDEESGERQTSRGAWNEDAWPVVSTEYSWDERERLGIRLTPWRSTTSPMGPIRWEYFCQTHYRTAGAWRIREFGSTRAWLIGIPNPFEVPAFTLARSLASRTGRLVVLEPMSPLAKSPASSDQTGRDNQPCVGESLFGETVGLGTFFVEPPFWTRPLDFLKSIGVANDHRILPDRWPRPPRPETSRKR